MNVPPPQNELREADVYSFEPEVYEFVHSTLKEHEVRIWKTGPTGPVQTDRLLADVLNCFQDGSMNNKMNQYVSMTLFKLALIYSGHYESTGKANAYRYRKSLYYIIPNFLRQGRFNQPLKDIVKNSATSLKMVMKTLNHRLKHQYIAVLGEEKYENIANRIDQDIDQKAEVLVNAIDKPPSNKNILGPNYVPSGDIVKDLITVEHWQSQIYESGKERLFDVNLIPKNLAYSDPTNIYVTHKLVIATPEEQRLLLEDNTSLHFVWYMILRVLEPSGLSLTIDTVRKQLNIPPNIYEQRRRKVHVLSQLLEVGAAYVTPNIVAELLDVDDEAVARKVLTAFAAKAE